MSLSILTLRPREFRRAAQSIGLLVLALITMGSGTCVVVEEGPPGVYEEPGVNEERMEDQELEVMEESNR
jgi:hypothetical protein